MTLIDNIKQHKEAARLFKAFLLTKRTPEQVKKFLAAKDSLQYGELIEFLHNYGASIVLTSNSVYIVVDKQHSSRFAVVAHNNMLYMHFARVRNSNDMFTLRFNQAIVEFFKLLNESIL